MTVVPWLKEVSRKCKVDRERPPSREPTQAPLVFFIPQQLSGLVSLTKRLEQPTTNLSSHYHQYVPVLISCELSRGSGLQISVSRLKPFVRSCARLTFMSLSSFGLLRRTERLSFIRKKSGCVVCFFTSLWSEHWFPAYGTCGMIRRGALLFPVSLLIINF